MEVRYHNDETNDPPNFRAIPYDALNVGLGAIGKIKGTHIAAGAHSGCLTILKFDNMHQSLYDPNFGLQNNSTHICFEMPVDVVRWNPMNETQGTYLAAGTKACCLTILNFEQLYCALFRAQLWPSEDPSTVGDKDSTSASS